VELWLGLRCERPVGMAGCGGRRRSSVCSRGAQRCSWVGVGRLLVLGGHSGSREASRPSAEGWPNQWRALRGMDDGSRDVPLAVFWMRD